MKRTKASSEHPNERGTGFSFGVGEKLTAHGVKLVVAEQRGDLRVLEREDTLERRIQSETALAELYRDGFLFPGHGDAPSSRDELSPEWAPYSSCIAPPISDASPAAQRVYHTASTLIAALRQDGFACLRPRPSLALHYRQLQCRIATAASIEGNPELATSVDGVRGFNQAQHLWALLKEHQPKGNPEDLQLPQLSTLYAWSLKLDKAGGDSRAIVPNFSDRGGRGNSRLLPSVEKAKADAIDAIRYSKDLRITAVELEHQISNRLIDRFGHEFAVQHGPSRSTCSRVVKSQFSAYEVCLRNKGADAAALMWRTWYPRDRSARPLEVVEFDDKDSRVFLIDEETNLPFGRGHVTCGVDQYNQLPLGFSISEQSRSTWSALSCLVECMVPHDMTREEFEHVRQLDLPWGKPAIAVFDNATYNHVADISASTREANVIPAWATPYTPTEKACIEYFNGRMDRDYFSRLGGYGGPKVSRDGLKQGVESAVNDRRTFVQGLMKWAYGVYANEPSVDGLTRWQGWLQALRNVTRRFPYDIYRLTLAPTLRHKVHLRPEGVLFTGIPYWSDRLLKLMKEHGPKAEVSFRYHPQNLNSIFVLDPTSRTYFEVPSSMPEYTRGLTLYQHRLVRKMARLRRKANPALADMLREKEELRKLVSQSKRSKKLRDRKWAGRVGVVGDDGPAGKELKPKEPEIIVVTDLEDQTITIDEVEMEAAEEGWEVPDLV